MLISTWILIPTEIEEVGRRRREEREVDGRRRFARWNGDEMELPGEGSRVEGLSREENGVDDGGEGGEEIENDGE
jgi:hypothetical protein